MKLLKKSICLVLACLMLVASVPVTEMTFLTDMLSDLFTVSAEAEVVDSGTCGANLSWTLDDNGTLTISGTGDMYDWSWYVNVPWYSDKNSITNVSIAYGVTSIGDSAFDGCTGLTSISIPNSVTSIGDCAFYGCTGLTSISIPNSVTSIDTKAFAYCKGLISITVDKDNTVYHSENNCLIKTADKTLILGCKTSVIPSDGSVTSIGFCAFNCGSGLTSITIPSSVINIGYEAFSYCTGLTSITVDKNNTVYHSENNCLIKTADKTLILGCKTSVIPPDGSVTSIGDYAFSYCIGLTSISIPNSVTSIGNCAFYGCTGLTSITIPNSVTSIGDYAFKECTGLTSITIPNSVTSIGNCAFYGCTGLTSISIPNSVTSIGNYTFYGCTGLTSITIPNSVTSIGSLAFYGCRGLKSITIENGVTSIGDYAFCECSRLTSITIPKSVTSIGYSAFGHIECLYDVYYEGTEAEWKSIAIDVYNATLENATKHYSFDYNYVLSTATVTLSNSSYVYDGTFKKPTVIVKNKNGTVITNGTSYTVKYCCSAGCKSVGTHKVTVTGKGNYTGTVTKTFTIKKDLTAGTATLSATSYTYNAAVKKPTVTVKNSAGTVITNGSSYTVAYCCSGGCKTPGTHTVTITGMGNYAGTIKKTFTINKQQIISARVTLSGTSFTYDGAVKKPTATVKTIQGTTLTCGSSYKLAYCCTGGCKTLGTHTVTITGMGNYTGTVKKTFTIKKDLAAGTATLSCTSYTYNAAVKKPTVTVKNSAGTVITNGSSYTVAYCCSGGCKTAGTHTVTITGIGNYAGTIKKTFTINKQQIISARVTLSATSFTYDGNVKKPTVTVKTIQGTTLTNGSSYKVTYCCSGGCKTKGTHKVTVTAIGSNYTGTVTKSFTIQ